MALRKRPTYSVVLSLLLVLVPALVAVCIIIALYIDKRRLVEMLTSSESILLWGMIVILMGVLATLAVLIRRLNRNITQLRRFVRDADEGRDMELLPTFANDELGEISRHMVNLYMRIRQTSDELVHEHAMALHQEQEKIRIKQQLTNNINHELKTPVASIQVCLETLLSGINLTEEKKQELIERCYANNERLRRLLEDVSLITRMESGSLLIGKESVAINHIIDEMKDELDIMPENERLDLHVDFNEEVVVEGNLSLIGSIFRNLTENAIAYSGGKNIYISLIDNNEESCTIRFEDDGCGVDEMQLPRLFERFYRVDKGRSRRLGGTGLGLAIVKHAVQFHGGTIAVSNRSEGGLRFEFSLKK